MDTGTISRALSLLTLVIASVLTPAVATAEYVTIADPRGDVMRVLETNLLVPAPDRVQHDILRTRFRHRSHRVRVRMEFADLRRTESYASYYVRIVTNEGVNGSVTVTTSRGMVVGTHVETTPDVTCPSAHRSIDYSHNVVVLGLARTCVSRPRWVRMAAYASAGEFEEGHFGDDAARRGLDAKRWDSGTLTAPLQRGSS